jgi:hypothetical protein
VRDITLEAGEHLFYGRSGDSLCDLNALSTQPEPLR